MNDDHHQMTLEALADVEAGSVIEHQMVQDWAEKLGSNKQLLPPELDLQVVSQ